MRVFKAAFRVIVGVLFGIGATISLTPAFAAFATDSDKITPIIMMVLVLSCGILGFFAPTIRRAFGRGFLVLGAATFLLPISAFLLSGRAASEVVNGAEKGTEGLAVVGAGLAGVAVTGVATFVGLILGAVFLTIGLILSLGGRREVVIAQTSGRREPILKN